MKICISQTMVEIGSLIKTLNGQYLDRISGVYKKRIVFSKPTG